ncbi:hypothetical protein [Archangium minus]|uniref:hypothetical protein n=1 Tax=Archangium minus TaxID=83450 RepID=UPI0037C10AA9
MELSDRLDLAPEGRVVVMWGKAQLEAELRARAYRLLYLGAERQVAVFARAEE